MSRETLEWLNNNTLIGFTEKRGNAWHYREGADNHYPGPVPVEDALNRLFGWTAEERPLYIETPIGDDGDSMMMPIEGRKAIVRSDNSHVMGIFKEGYVAHQYSQWLVENVATILDDDLQIGSAGLLKGGAVAWVSVEVPDNIITPEGVEFRPNLMASGSFDGSLASTYGRHITHVVCDNTMGIASGEHGDQRIKFKSTKNSFKRIGDAREALGIIHGAADDFAAEVAALCSTKVTDHQFEAIMDVTTPLPEADASKRAQTMAENKRDALWELWTSDERVIQWRGTAFGAWQAYNTYQHHESIVRGASRPERNLLRAVDGTTQANDMETLQTILAVAA
jgi:phage/plasmid-like protein (TIGR03299 family)